MSRFIIVISIIVIVILGAVLCKINYINERLVFFNHQNGAKLPLATEMKNDSAKLGEQDKFMANSKTLVHLVAVGDMMLSRNVGQKMVERKDYQYPFRETEDFLQKADFVFGNLESPIIAGPPVYTPSMVFRADPEVAGTLASAGFNILSLANNHILNQGAKGLAKTIELLQKEEIKTVGAGLNHQAAHQYQIFEKKGIKIAFLAYAYAGNSEATEQEAGVAIMEVEGLKKDLAAAKKEADIVIVSMHCGTEYTREPNPRQVDFAHQAIDLGADLVVGHHPHWFQAVEQYQGKYIIYSLGNFVFDQMWSAETREGMVASIFLDKTGVSGLTFWPVKIFDYSQPRFVGASETKRLLSMLNLDLKPQPSFFYRDSKYQEGEHLGWQGERVFANVPAVLNQDLDGDAKREKIIFEEGKMQIWRGQDKIWESDLDWRINDYAVADFDGDGELELALALWKQGDYAPDAPLETLENRSHWGSHLFLYHFQDGECKIMWGSSLLPQPILEIDAGDLNQDGKAELAVLEGKNQDTENLPSQNLSIMSWSGWGFVKDWEKQGQYYNLRVYKQGNLGYYVYVNSVTSSQ